ncbi:hypothetical protein BGZ54_008717 [Gamsiella multidivaricata]|nr:hypothetical protein BGZ54_008717 [Gamsiella multidivaricata]
MEILKDDFETKLPLLQKAIAECDFVAVDTEMTGLASPANVPKYQDSLASRYSKISISASNFLVIQLGVCTFTWSEEAGGYEARPFNFPCFPASSDVNRSGERFFKCQSSSLEFLLSNGFDFNKWIRHGIPYLTRQEEETYIVRKKEKTAVLATTTSTANNIPIDDRNREFITSTVVKIRGWFENSTETTLTISAPNSFFRRLVYQILRSDFNDELHATPNSQARTMTIQRLTDEIRQQQEEAKVVKAPMLNLRRVLDTISDARKPLIGHNCFLDLMQITQQFLWDLPLDLDDWKRAVMLEWNFRYQADASVSDAENDSVDGVAAKSATKDTNNEIKYHEAGYDAYITGQAFLRFAGYILKERERLSSGDDEHTRKKRRLEDVDLDNAQGDAPESTSGALKSKPLVAADDVDEEEEGEVSETEMEKDALLEKRKRVIMDNPTKDILETEELKNYYNLLHIMRSDIPVMNLAGPDQEPEERPWSYLLKNIPSNFETSTLFHLFASYNPFRFNWMDTTSAWIQLSQRAPASEGEESSGEPYEPTPLPLGRLGEAYVNPLCVGGGGAAVKGRDAGIVPEAADIEVVSWRAWYDEREELERQQRHLLYSQQQQQQQQQAQSGRDPNVRFPKRPIRVNGASTPQDSPQVLSSSLTTSASSPRTSDGSSINVIAASTTDNSSKASDDASVATAGTKRKQREDEDAVDEK